MILSTNSIGIDEVGRWPLAWPVGGGGVFCLSNFEKPDRYDEIQDSKKLSAWQREHLATLILSHPSLVCATSLVSAKVIDQHGIVYAIRKATVEVIEKIVCSEQRRVNNKQWKVNNEEGLVIQLDGKTDYGLRAVLPYPLETIIKWDQKIWQIAAASIIAKVERDQYMTDLCHKKKYAVYGFERHKGYGTLMHRQAISHYGLSSEHRKSFCKKFV